MNTKTHLPLALDRKAISGFVMAGIVLLAFGLVYERWMIGAAFAAAFCVAGVLRIKTEKPWLTFPLWFLYTGACVFVLLFLPWYEMYATDMFYQMAQYTQGSALLINALLIVMILAVFIFITGRLRVSLILVSVLLSALTLANSFVYRLRGKELLFSDILSAGTAFNVVEGYQLSLPVNCFLACCLLVLLLFAGFCLPREPVGKGIRQRLAALALGAVLLVPFLLHSSDMKTRTWNLDGTLINGYYLNFYLSIRDAYVDAPQQYSAEFIQELEEKYSQDDTTELPADSLPNVLVIMNEAFSDLRVYNPDLKTNIPVTPFLDSLQENAVRGYALSSVFGGQTANSEFEFLTGYSMNFFPSGATPYQQYIHRETHSLAWELHSLGYKCVSTHPFVENGWNRPTVYPLLGFSESTYIDDYPGKDLVRGYVSDQEMYEFVLDKLKAETEPLFLFGITMQNHGGYTGELHGVDQMVSLEGYEGHYPRAEQYLTLINLSDKALESLITQLSSFSEDTIVLFFGDHQPNLEAEFYTEIGGLAAGGMNAQMQKYKVPFFIWANYDMEEKNVDCTSISFLSRYLLEAAGLPVTPFYRFLEDTEAVIPVLNAEAYYSRSAQSFLPVGDAQGEEKQWLSQYEVLQYNGIFEKTDISEVFWGSGTD